MMPNHSATVVSIQYLESKPGHSNLSIAEFVFFRHDEFECSDLHDMYRLLVRVQRPSGLERM
jgi:hypothetical protein